jgi:phosphoglycolate phosphatase-like HAD superfamily hydrolase
MKAHHANASFELVIFDFDGTLIDSKYDIRNTISPIPSI